VNLQHLFSPIYYINWPIINKGTCPTTRPS